VPRLRKETGSRPSDEEYQRFSEQFADVILDPRQKWLAQYLLTGGFGQIPTEQEINSGAFALRVLEFLKRDYLVEEWLYEALNRGDKRLLIPWIKLATRNFKTTREEMSRLLSLGKPSVLRNSAKQLTDVFKFHRGPRPKLPSRQYAEILRLAEVLRPAVLELLRRLDSKTRRSPEEILNFLLIDYPDACKFLLSNISRVHQALNDPRLRSRAKKRIVSRARVLADALAGSEYGLQFSTSIERVGEARRTTSKTSS
jgi:hypothetical protein